jgi:hypothetical protein
MIWLLTKHGINNTKFPWFQASAAMLMGSVLFSGVTQCRVVILYWRFGTKYLSHLQGSRGPRRVESRRGKHVVYVERGMDGNGQWWCTRMGEGRGHKLGLFPLPCGCTVIAHSRPRLSLYKPHVFRAGFLHFLDFLNLEDATDTLSQNVGKGYHLTLRYNPEECRSQHKIYCYTIMAHWAIRCPINAPVPIPNLTTAHIATHPTNTPSPPLMHRALCDCKSIHRELGLLKSEFFRMWKLTIQRCLVISKKKGVIRVSSFTNFLQVSVSANKQKLRRTEETEG